MEDKYHIEGIFPLPLLIANLPNSFSYLKDFFDNQSFRGSKEGIPTQDYGEISKNTKILNEPECKNLHDYILSIAADYAQNILNLENSKYKFSLSWVSIKHPNQAHQFHSHSNSTISGVFYYGHCPKDIPGICFYPLHFNNQNHFAVSTKTEFNPLYPVATFPAISGRLYMFPSQLFHSVPVNNTSFPRKSIAFNIIPTGKIGSENTLNELFLS